MPAEHYFSTPDDHERHPSYYDDNYEGGIHELLEAVKGNIRGEPSTFGASPLDRERTYAQQLAICEDLRELTYRDLPDGVPLEIMEFVGDTFTDRFWGRCAANDEKYAAALVHKSDYADHPDIIEMIDRGEEGYASPAELLVIRDFLEMGGIELASLTHPYGTHIGMLDDMRFAVHEAVMILGGTYYDEPETKYRVKYSINDNIDSPAYDKGLLMTRKRIVGALPDGTIIAERSSFVLRTDGEGLLSPEEKAAMQAVDLKDPEWQNKVSAAGHLDEKVVALLKNNEHATAIPISTTTYAYNPETSEKIEQASKQKKNHVSGNGYDRFASNSKAFRELDGQDSPSQKEHQDIKGMFYVGPKIMGSIAVSEKIDLLDDEQLD